MGLRRDGSVLSTVRDSPTAVWSDVLAVAAGSGHTVALRSDGTVVATADLGGVGRDVATWTDIEAVAAGSEFTLGLRSDGTVVGAGVLPG
nr:hypothetical protein [Gordonia humi]